MGHLDHPLFQSQEEKVLLEQQKENIQLIT